MQRAPDKSLSTIAARYEFDKNRTMGGVETDAEKQYGACNSCGSTLIQNCSAGPYYLVALEYASDNYARSLHECEVKTINEIHNDILSCRKTRP